MLLAYALLGFGEAKAERQRFELWEPFRARQFSKLLP